MSKNEGLQHIHKLMHVLIEGIAAGVYTSKADIEADANQYLQMEKAVEKMSTWNEDSSVEELAGIFEGISHSMEEQKQKEEEKKSWRDIADMPDLAAMQECFANALKTKESEREDVK